MLRLLAHSTYVHDNIGYDGVISRGGVIVGESMNTVGMQFVWSYINLEVRLEQRISEQQLVSIVRNTKSPSYLSYSLNRYRIFAPKWNQWHTLSSRFPSLSSCLSSVFTFDLVLHFYQRIDIRIPPGDRYRKSSRET